MDYGEAPLPSASVETEPSSPPRDSSLSPVGTPENAVLEEVHSPPSDDDVDGADHEHEVAASADDLKKKIIKQVQYYFSDDNLPTDKYMLGFIKKNKGGFVPIGIIASFRKMKKLTQDHSVIVDALKESSLLAVSSDGKKVKRVNPLPLTEVKDPKLCTVLVENLPEDHSVENIKRIFGKAGAIKNICFRDPNVPEEPKKGSKAEVRISGKLHAFVEYETEQSAEKAASTLNNEQDWRNGMRVKLLSRVGKYVQRRQAWKGHDSDKNGVGLSSEQAGGDEKDRNCERHDDAPDEEGGDHSLREKNGQKGQIRGHPRRNNKYRSTNGHGHWTTSSTHGTEPHKPPPGPRMPDGTRGFAMGRGKPWRPIKVGKCFGP